MNHRIAIFVLLCTSAAITACQPDDTSTSAPPSTQAATQHTGLPNAATGESTPATIASPLAAIREQIEDDGNDFVEKDEDRPIINLGFEYIAGHLNDDAVKQFNPQAGFTNYIVNRDSSGNPYFMLERHTPTQNNGLNLRYDPATKSFSNAKYWGTEQSLKNGN